MANYCRYCGKKEKDLHDNFCYSCRKSSKPVDYFFRFAKKVNLDEDEIDLIRDCGEGLALAALLGASFAAFLLTFALIINATDHPVEGFRTLGFSIVILIVILVIMLIYMIFGLGLMRLDKRFADRNWKINAIMLFIGLFRSRRGGAAIISAALTSKKKREREHILKIALTHLATGEKTAVKVKEINQPLSDWVCSYCGYKNPSGRMDCKSCGKIK